MFDNKSLLSCLGIAAAAFGAGSLAASFLPAKFLVILTSLLLIAAGIFYVNKKGRCCS